MGVHAGVAALAAVGRLVEAEQLMQDAWAHGVKAGRGAFNRLISAHAERGDMLSARRLYSRMKSLYTPMPDKCVF
jgi:pentatricopeptide repeat protein